MKKQIILGIVSSVCVLALTGCTLATPLGTLLVEFDSDAKSEKIIYTDETGNTKEINTEDLNEQLDNMLENVDLPKGTTTEDLKGFVHGTSETIGVDKTIDDIQEQLDSATQGTISENGNTETQAE